MAHESENPWDYKRGNVGPRVSEGQITIVLEEGGEEVWPIGDVDPHMRKLELEGTGTYSLWLGEKRLGVYNQSRGGVMIDRTDDLAKADRVIARDRLYRPSRYSDISER